MKEKTFQWTVLIMLAVTLVVSLVAVGGKRQANADGTVEFKMFGKTLKKSTPKQLESSKN